MTKSNLSCVLSKNTKLTCERYPRFTTKAHILSPQSWTCIAQKNGKWFSSVIICKCMFHSSHYFTVNKPAMKKVGYLTRHFIH